MNALLDALRAVVGDAHVITTGDMAGWESDWRGRYRGRCLAVVRPGNTEEVAAVVRRCAAASPPVGIVPQGGNTGLVGGGVPDTSGRQILLSLTRLDRVRAVDPDNLSMTVEAGCVLQVAQATAADAGLLFPLSLAAEGSCTVGGNLATNAGGTQVLRFGNARSLCLGLEVVTPQGELWSSLSGLRKDNTGYDLRDLYIGSEGTLGVITAATLSLFPRPRAVVTAWVALEGLSAAVTLLRRLRTAFDAALTAFEVLNRHSLDLVKMHFPALREPLSLTAQAEWVVLLELASPHDESWLMEQVEIVLADALETGEIVDASLARSGPQAEALWQWREAVPLAQAKDGLNIKHDIGVPVSAVPDFVAAADAALAVLLPGARHVTFGHLGDGNLHYNLQAKTAASSSRATKPP